MSLLWKELNFSVVEGLNFESGLLTCMQKKFCRMFRIAIWLQILVWLIWVPRILNQIRKRLVWHGIRRTINFVLIAKSLLMRLLNVEMSSQLASQFDPLGMAAPHLLGGKLILQRVAALGVDWYEILRVDIQDCWKKWVGTMNLFQEFSIPRNCLPENVTLDNKDVKFQLRWFFVTLVILRFVA